MRPNLIVRKFIVVALLVGALCAGSRVVPALDLDQLTADATFIAVGQIVSTREVGKTVLSIGDQEVSARSMAAELRVDQTLKGFSGRDPFLLQFQFVLPEEPVGWRKVDPFSYRIFFLKSVSGGLTIANPYYPSLIAIPGIEVKEDTPIERVVSLLGAVLASPTASLEQKREAVFPLTRTKSLAAIRALKGGAEERDLALRLSVSAALLERDDISTLQSTEAILRSPNPALPDYLVHNLAYAISQGVRNEEAVPSLTRLLRARSTETRRAAASALMHVSTNSSIKTLLITLSDSDLQVRYYSVVGLAEITGQMDWRPNMDDFVSDQQRYLNHWREWARNRQISVAPSQPQPPRHVP
jgi:hypothetical protein